MAWRSPDSSSDKKFEFIYNVVWFGEGSKGNIGASCEISGS